VLVVGYVVAARTDLVRPAGPVASAQSVAVLPFVNLSGDTAYEYFSDGMTEELIDALVQVPGLQVPARTSAFVFKGKTGDIREIGRRLNVSTVVEGSVRRSGTRLRVAAQLIKVADGYHLWSATYERELRDVFAVQDEIARAIVQALRVKLAPAAASARPENLAAYQLYLKGRLFWNRGTEEGLNRAREFFSAAIAQDSGDARAYAGLADTYERLLALRYLPRAEGYPKARAAALRAVALDSQLADGYTARGQIRSFDEWDWSGAEQDFRRAVALNPGYALAHLWYGDFLVLQGRFPEGIREARRAAALDPLSTQVLLSYSELLSLARQYGPALEQARTALELEPSAQGHQRLATAYLFQDRFADAIREYQTALGLLGGRGREAGNLARLGYAYARAGRRPEALHMLDQIQALAPSVDSVSGGYELALADLYAALGDKDQAFVWLERAYQERDYNLNNLRVNPFFDPLRPDPRFTQLLKKVGLGD
jgi:TolB-like protein